MRDKRSIDNYNDGVIFKEIRLSAEVIPDSLEAERQHRSRDENRGYLDGIYMISVVARILEMHPQTLRKYERAGLVQPSRTLGMVRLYSEQDVGRLRLIKYLVDDVGMNLAGVEFVLRLFNRLQESRNALEEIQKHYSLPQGLHNELRRLLSLVNIVPDSNN